MIWLGVGVGVGVGRIEPNIAIAIAKRGKSNQSHGSETKNDLNLNLSYATATPGQRTTAVNRETTRPMKFWRANVFRLSFLIFRPPDGDDVSTMAIILAISP